jgi:tetratricopeptide (TPR) repeat protein
MSSLYSIKRLLLLLGLVIGSVTLAQAGNPQGDFAKANEFYKNKDYDKAIVLYQGIVDHGLESAPIYFNLGNAYFKNGDLGRAILYYMKAERLDPGNDDIRSNIAFARQFTSIQMEGVQLNPINSFIESLVSPYRIDTLAWITTVFFVLFIAIMAVRYGFGITGSYVKAGIVIALILLATSSFVTTFKYRNDYLTRRAVLVTDDAPVRSGPSDEMDVEIQGAPGLVVQILSESGDYFNVQFENNRRGWIKKNQVAEI